jgi:ribosome-associated protein
MAKTERKRSSTESAAVARPARNARRVASARRPTAAPLPASSETARAGSAGRETASRKSRKLPSEVSRAVRAALDKKAHDVVVLDLRHTPAFTDFFVLCSGLNPRQVKAIADAVEETLRAAKVRPAHIEGYDRAEWVLMDFFSFIVHVFTPQTRAFYGLERLWGDAERINVSEEQPAGS